MARTGATDRHPDAHGLRSADAAAIARGNGGARSGSRYAKRSSAARQACLARRISRSGGASDRAVPGRSQVSDQYFEQSIPGHDPSILIELVVDAGAHDVVGDARVERGRDGRIHVRRDGWAGRDRSQIHVEIFELAGPIADQLRFDADARGPAGLGLVLADDGVDRIARAVEPEEGA